MIQLLELAQPDGQYAAAAALYNLAGQEVEVRLTIVACKAVPALVRMLQAHSWSVPLHLLHLVAARRLILSMLFGSYLTGHMPMAVCTRYQSPCCGHCCNGRQNLQHGIVCSIHVTDLIRDMCPLPLQARLNVYLYLYDIWLMLF